MFLGNEGRGIADSDIVKRSNTNFDLPLKRNMNGGFVLKGKLVLTSMTSDFFIEEADEWRDEAWSIIRKRKDLTFEILTKRPQRIPDCLPNDWNDGYSNVRLSVSAEDQKAWDERVGILIDIHAKKRDVFIAPMISGIDTDPLLSKGKIGCIYLGGEYCFGEPRVCDYEWVLKVRESCIRNRVSLFWRNCGQRLLYKGSLLQFNSIREQGNFTTRRNLDVIYDDPLPKVAQRTLF